MFRASRPAAKLLQTLRTQRKAFHSGPIASRQLSRGLVATAAIVLGTGVGSYLTATPVYLDAAPPNERGLISYHEVHKHNSRDSCWVIIDGQVYDATSILDTHPGGTAVLLKAAGKDATKIFMPIHSPGTLNLLPPKAFIGPIDPSTVPREISQSTEEEIRIAAARAALPPPEAAINLRDIEEFAKSVLTSTAWAYYRSSADDDDTFFENAEAFKRFWFRPRVMNKISQISTSTTMLGMPVSLPIYIAPAALARLGHPDGEMNLVRAAGKENILQGISTNSSCSIDEIVSAKQPGQELIFQLYLNKHRSASEVLIQRIEKEGFKAIMLTVDAAVPGKRELDQRAKASGFSGPSHGSKSNSEIAGGKGVAHAISGYQDPDVCWADIAWIKSQTSLPIIIKGIQCVEDAEIAFEKGASAIILSNHGGRELNFSPAPLTILHELYLQRPDLLKNHEVYIDGGVTRGTDVIKALCLGARAVGLGRPFLYGNGVWGEEGCRRVIQIMREEIETGMRLMGVTSIDQLKPELLRYGKEASPRRSC